MSTANVSTPVKSSPAPSKSKKARKKKSGAKDKPIDEIEHVNGTAVGTRDGEASDVEPSTPVEPPSAEPEAEHEAVEATIHPEVNGTGTAAIEKQLEALHVGDGASDAPPAGDASDARWEALTRERSALRDEVVQLRQSLEELQGRHAEELQGVRGQLDDSREERDNAETQYRNLLGKVNTIKSQLGERLKADADELAQARSQLDELHEHNAALQTENEAREGDIAALTRAAEERSRELSGLRNRLTLAQATWARERAELAARGDEARDEGASARQAMQDWEVLAMEERSIREGLGERVAELEEQAAQGREAQARLEAERAAQAASLDGVQRALQEVQEARKREFREVVENTQSQIETLRTEVAEKTEAADTAAKTLETTKKELERMLPFEVEAKEKNLLIGKLRHEAVILNDHLTKALKKARKDKPEDTIDRQLVTNHFLHFLTLDRSDPRKFQILQIIAALLNWSEDQREQAGLARPGASNPNLRTPISPWHRTPSTPSLSQADLASPGDDRGRTGSLWSDGPATAGSGRGSRSPSVSSSKP